MVLRVCLWLTVTLTFFAAQLTPTASVAQLDPALPVLEIRNDRGGKLRPQLSRLETLRLSGQPVRISGDICYSTCTMYLGLPQTCVMPTTTFGFHGPSQYGRPLDQATFEQASRLIMAQYPPVLQDWYMAYGRHELRGLLKVTGAHLIRIGGAKPCPVRIAAS